MYINHTCLAIGRIKWSTEFAFSPSKLLLMCDGVAFGSDFGSVGSRWCCGPSPSLRKVVFRLLRCLPEYKLTWAESCARLARDIRAMIKRFSVRVNREQAARLMESMGLGRDSCLSTTIPLARSDDSHFQPPLATEKSNLTVVQRASKTHLTISSTSGLVGLRLPRSRWSCTHTGTLPQSMLMHEDMARRLSLSSTRRSFFHSHTDMNPSRHLSAVSRKKKDRRYSFTTRDLFSRRRDAEC